MISKIAVLKGPGIGDVTTSIPLLRNLRKNFPGAQITIFNEAGYGVGRKLLEKCPYADKILEIRQKSGVLYWLEKIFEIRKERFDVIIDSYPSTYKTAIFCALSGAKIRCGYTTNPLSFLYSIKIDPGTRNLVEAEEEILAGLGGRPDGKGLEIFLDTKTADITVKKFLEENGISDSDFLVAVHTGRNNDAVRTWPDTRWARLCDILTRRGTKVVFVGSNIDARRAETSISFMKTTPANFVGNRSLEETAAMLKRADLCITIDGGIMHLAAALNRPLVALCGYTKPGWFPYSKNSVVIKKDPEGSRDISDYSKGDASAMDAIAVEDVLDAIRNNTSKLK